MKDEMLKLLRRYYQENGLKAPKSLEQTVDSVQAQLDQQIQANRVLTIDWDSLKGTSVMIGTPMYGGQCLDIYHQSVLKTALMAQERGIKIDSYVLGNESLIQRGRNTIANEFMASDFEYLMFIDADIGFSPEGFFQLLQLKEKISGAVYSVKQHNWEAIKRRAPELTAEQLEYAGARFAWNPKQKGQMKIERYSPIEVKHLATGFLLIHRSVFEQFQVQYPELRYKNNHLYHTKYFSEPPEEIWQYFHCDKDDRDEGTMLSEDYWFCRKVTDMGFEIWLCPWINLTHRGTCNFAGDFITSLIGVGHK